MKPSPTLFAVLAAAPALAAPGGPLATLTPGSYVCELPGDAGGPAGLRQDAESFTVLSATNYQAPGGVGTYLVTGDIVTMTSGPKNGQKFRKISPNFLRKLGAGGSDSDLRCVRGVVNNS